MSISLKKAIFIVAAKRTPFGKYGGALKDVHTSDLYATAAREALRSARVEAAAVDTVNVGHVHPISCSGDGALTARHGALKAGVPHETPAMSVNMQCGSGFQTLVNSAQDILTGAAEISLCGGTDNMSGIPFLVRDIRFGVPLGGRLNFEDAATVGPQSTLCDFPLVQAAEELAEKYGLRRGEVDEFALRSHQKWKTGQDSDAFAPEMAAVIVKTRNKEVVVNKDELPNPELTVACLCKLPVVYKKGGVVTLGNSSGVADGAGAVVVASEAAVVRHNLSPLARIVGWSTLGGATAPVPAIHHLLKATRLSLQDIDLIEINETFAAYTLACIKELGVDGDKVNVNGGALSIGHPVAASGARILAHLVHQLRLRGLQRAIGSTCVGEKQGIAVLIESV